MLCPGLEASAAAPGGAGVRCGLLEVPMKGSVIRAAVPLLSGAEKINKN